MEPRKPSTLDLFLLALIDSGLSTPYEFQRQAGISVGASLPALRYLLSRRFVTRGKRGERQRMAYSLTRDGRALLKDPAISTSAESSDLPSALRLAILAGHGRRQEQGLQVLQRHRLETGDSHGPDVTLDLRSPATMYRWMMSVRERHQRKADLQALSEIIRRLKQKLR